jgi:YegS/Rv2252/BmrU family lipid kinase
VSRVAVVVHRKKAPRHDLSTVRAALEAAGVADPLWYEVRKSKQARKRARKAAKDGADLVFAWGGDGTVQRCVDALAGRDVALAVIPAGTSNLLATALGIPEDLDEAVQVGLSGRRRVLDTGTVNGERFAVVAGAGLDALLVRDADSDLKGRMGRAAYVLSAVKHLRTDARPAEVRVDGRRVFQGRCTSVLVGNTRGAVGGLDVFESSEPDDGVLEVGVVTAQGPLQLVRTAARAVLGAAEGSPFLRTARGRSIRVRFAVPVPYELDGGDRKPVRTLQVKVRPRSITVCVPRGKESRGDGPR